MPTICYMSFFTYPLSWDHLTSPQVPPRYNDISLCGSDQPVCSTVQGREVDPEFQADTFRAALMQWLVPQNGVSILRCGSDFKLWGLLTVDMFITVHNVQLPKIMFLIL